MAARRGAAALPAGAPLLVFLLVLALQLVPDPGAAAAPLEQGSDGDMSAPLAAGAEREPEPPPEGPPDQAPSAENGLRIYGERCASCHGPYGRGRGEMLDRLPSPPPSFADAAYMREVSPLEAFQVVTNGRLEKLMPPWRDALSPSERWDVVYGAWSFHYRPDALVAGREAFETACAACHGLSGEPAGALSSPAWWFERSQRDAFDAYLARVEEDAVGGHRPLEELEAAALWAALDYARSTTFDALPFEDLRLDGEIDGRVVNASEGESGVSGARVTLVPFQERTAGILPSTPISTSVGDEGRFSFTGLLSGPGISYRTVASYRGADIIQDERIPLGGDAPLRAEPELRVYAPSDSVALRARQVQIALSPDPASGGISVAEAWAIVNPSDRLAVAAQGGHLLRFPVPEEAQGLVFEDPRMNEAFEREASEVSLDLPLPPGESLIVMAYGLPWTGTELDFDRELPLPVDALHLIAVGDEVAIESEALREQRSEMRGDQRVLDASSVDLEAGSRVLARIIGLPAPQVTTQAPAGMQPLPPPPLSREQLGWIALLASLLMGVAILVLPGSSAKRSVGLRVEREALVRRLAELDAGLERGEIDGEHHRTQRARLVERALDLMRAERDIERPSG